MQLVGMRAGGHALLRAGLAHGDRHPSIDLCQKTKPKEPPFCNLCLQAELAAMLKRGRGPNTCWSCFQVKPVCCQLASLVALPQILPQQA